MNMILRREDVVVVMNVLEKQRGITLRTIGTGLRMVLEKHDDADKFELTASEKPQSPDDPTEE